MNHLPRLLHLRFALTTLLAVVGVIATAAAITLIAALPSSRFVWAQEHVPPPARLSETGLFVAGTTRVREENLPFVPQYPLWSDGASKRRWLHLPSGTAIDAAQIDAWEFPPGTRLWKEFSHGRPIETRLIERLADGSWRYAAYVWNAGGDDALLASGDGVVLVTARAPGGAYVVPSQDDCRTCHEGTPVPVLGVSALQLSPDRDPLAPNAEPAVAAQVDLHGLAARGLLHHAPASLFEAAPRIDAPSPTARAALGYLHANCGHCHNDRGPLAEIDLVLAQASADATAMQKTSRTTIGFAAETRAFGLATRVVPGHPEQSQLAARMRSRNPVTQMPPLGTAITDDEGVALVERWIRQLQTREEQTQ